MLWSYTLAGLGVLSLYLTGKKKKSGWLVGLVNSALWIIYAVITNQLGFLLSALVFIWVQSKNYLQWRRDDNA